MKKLLAFFLFVVVCVGAGAFVVHDYAHRPRTIESPFVLDVTKGASLHTVAKELGAFMEIGPKPFFVKVGQLYGYSKSIKFGEYEVSQSASIIDILKMLEEGKTKKYKFTFIEGSHIYDLANVLSEKKFGTVSEILRVLKDKETVQELVGESYPSLEGYLYPDTYYYTKTDGLKDVIRRMVEHLNTVFEALPKTDMSRHEVLTLASIIEKETGAGFERPLISSVFHNRLKKNMRLETDPTVMYGVLDATGKEISNIRKIHLRTPTAYNTYTMKGLPPGPIGNPGQKALEAAVRPEKSSHLFFVSRNDGTHVFTDTYKDHLKAVRNFQLNPNARKGKSWRDLKKGSQ